MHCEFVTDFVSKCMSTSFEQSGRPITTNGYDQIHCDQSYLNMDWKSMKRKCNLIFIDCKGDTVPAFNSCTKCAGCPGIIHNCTPDRQFRGHGCMCDVTTERSFFSHKLSVSLMCFAYFLNCCYKCFYNQALADVQSTGAGIKFLPLWG